MNIPTVAERDTILERIAVARYVAKHDRFPNAAGVRDELQQMLWAMTRNEPVVPRVTRAQAAQWLKEQGLTVPAPAETVKAPAPVGGQTTTVVSASARK